jgi:Ca2+/Na+ antiporter
LVIFLLYRYINVIFQDYVSPSLQKISRGFRFSPAIASVTLIGFANSGTQILAAMAASVSPQGVSYNIGLGYGGVVFGATLVFGKIILGRDRGLEFEMQRLTRDFFFLGVVMGVTALFVVFGGGTSVHCYCLLGVYCFLVVFLWFEEQYRNSDFCRVEEIGDRDEEMPVSWGRKFLNWFKWRKMHKDGLIVPESVRGEPELIDH